MDPTAPRPPVSGLSPYIQIGDKGARAASDI